MLPHDKAKELFESGKYTDEEALAYIKNKIETATTKYFRGWWISVSNKYVGLIYKRDNENKT